MKRIVVWLIKCVFLMIIGLGVVRSAKCAEAMSFGGLQQSLINWSKQINSLMVLKLPAKEELFGEIENSQAFSSPCEMRRLWDHKEILLASKKSISGHAVNMQKEWVEPSEEKGQILAVIHKVFGRFGNQGCQLALFLLVDAYMGAKFRQANHSDIIKIWEKVATVKDEEVKYYPLGEGVSLYDVVSKCSPYIDRLIPLNKVSVLGKVLARLRGKHVIVRGTSSDVDSVPLYKQCLAAYEKIHYEDKLIRSGLDVAAFSIGIKEAIINSSGCVYSLAMLMGAAFFFEQTSLIVTTKKSQKFLSGFDESEIVGTAIYADLQATMQDLRGSMDVRFKFLCQKSAIVQIFIKEFFSESGVRMM